MLSVPCREKNHGFLQLDWEAISSHIRPYNHPDQEVIDEFEQRNKDYYRTDEHYHLTFTTDGQTSDIKYSRV